MLTDCVNLEHMKNAYDLEKQRSLTGSSSQNDSGSGSNFFLIF